MRVKDNHKVVETEIKNSELVRKKRLQIAMGASKLFIKKGYSQTSMREISKATGLTIGNLYDYITKKEDVLYLVFDTFHALWLNRLQEEGVFEIEDPVKQLNTAIGKMLELVNTHRDMVLLMYRESKSLPKCFLKTILENERGHIEGFERILKRGIKQGVFKSTDSFLLANIVAYLVSVEALRGWNFRKRYKIEEISKYIIEFVMNSIMR